MSNNTRKTEKTQTNTQSANNAVHSIDIDNKLQQRGILEAAAAARWMRSGNAWVYPIIDIFSGEVLAHRVKQADSNASPKYFWKPSKPDAEAAQWYLLAGTLEAIAAANGVVWLGNGEAALLSYRSANVANSIATTLSEVSVPKNIVSYLQALGVTEVRYPVDNDEAGRTSAENWRNALHDSGIIFKPLQWGEDAPEKADANDILIQYGGDAEAFRAKLDTLEALLLPAYKAPQSRKTSYEAATLDADYEAALEQRKRDIAALLGVTDFKDDGWTRKPISSPFRTDKKPSFGYNILSGAANDFGGETYSLKALCEFFGLEYPKRKRSKNKQADKPHISTWAHPVDLPSVQANERVNMRYISEYDPAKLKPTTLIKSPIATGKTELMRYVIAYLEKLYGRSITVLYVVHRQQLAKNIAARLQFECYDNIPVEYRGQAPKIVVSYDNLHRMQDSYDLVIIDEVDQLQPHVIGGTMNGAEAIKAYEKLKEIVSSSARVIALDAHLSDVTRAWFKDVRGDCHVIENLYRHNWRELRIQQYESAVIAAAINSAKGEKSKGAIITTASKNRSWIYEQLAKTRLQADEVFVINGDTSSSAEARRITDLITGDNARGKTLQQLTGLKLLIVSPSYGTGLDVQADVAGVYGVFDNQQWIDAQKITQQLMRFRQADERQLCIIGGFRETLESSNWRDEVSHYLKRAELTANSADFHTHNITTASREQQSILKLAAMYKANTAPQRNELFSYTIAAAEDEGFTIIYGDERSKPIDEALKLARQSLKDRNKANTLKAVPVSREELEALQQTAPPVEQLLTALDGYKRYTIEHTAGQAITADLCDILNTPRKRRNFSRLVDLLDTSENLIQRDRHEAENEVLLMKRGHHTRRYDLVNMACSSVFGSNWQNKTEHVTEKEIMERLESFIRTNLEDIQTFIDRRFDLSKDPLFILRRILKSICMKLGRKQIMHDGSRFMVYFIDDEHRNMMLDYARIALQARLEREKPITTNTYREACNNVFVVMPPRIPIPSRAPDIVSPPLLANL